ncbi:hypothetical protein SEA_REINDEER_137 [Mycobacterium phage Reindeer]|uniref:Uncharacterized protein n=1 Tax=Mycobacterium phage Reindeer TaxID=2762283 RepID=A0A7G8LI56_9CAUD|nr:hypothetical protein J4U05_gp115 [Mycobacterium phage Reindeer]QNJ56928.1 hypothetical protein SEA_REINDEER_137 [Mycobacterium phage Reindeer]
MITKRELLTIQDNAPLLTVVERELVSSHIEAIDHIHKLEMAVSLIRTAAKKCAEGNYMAATAAIERVPHITQYLTI